MQPNVHKACHIVYPGDLLKANDVIPPRRKQLAQASHATTLVEGMRQSPYVLRKKTNGGRARDRLWVGEHFLRLIQRLEVVLHKKRANLANTLSLVKQSHMNTARSRTSFNHDKLAILTH